MMGKLIGYGIYATIFASVLAATVKAAYDLYCNGRRAPQYYLKWDDEKQIFC